MKYTLLTVYNSIVFLIGIILMIIAGTLNFMIFLFTRRDYSAIIIVSVDKLVYKMAILNKE